MGERRRSGVFFVGDVRSAADDMALALEDHGLSQEQVDALADRLEQAAAEFFAEVWNG